MTRNDLLTTKQIAAILGVTERTLIDWRNKRIGPPWCKLGKKVRYRRQSLEQWIADSETRPKQGTV